MIECPIYYTVPGTTPSTPDPPVDDTVACGGCNCGYLQYEDLLEHLKELKDSLSNPQEDNTELEFKLRKSIIEVSRLFDIDAGVQAGFFSKAHYKLTKVVTSNGSKYIEIPPFVVDTLEVRSLDNIVIDPSAYAVENGFLVYHPCSQHANCACALGCGHKKYRRPRPWPNGCYKVTAKWGFECADAAVQMAVREYLIESYRMQDPVKVLASGIPVQTRFQVPYSWSSYIANFKAKRRIFSGYAIA